MKKTAILLISLLFPAMAQTVAISGEAQAEQAPTTAPGWRVGGLLAHSDIWTQYRDRFVKSDGRVVDSANGDISHSEGQGYGLLLAVAGGDRESFDRILAWTTEHLMVRDDNLIAWTPGDSNDAADGDALVAWALAEAVDYWRDPKYLRLAESIARGIATQLIDPRAGGAPLLRPGVKGFSSSERPDGPVVNPSYWVFPAFERLRELDPDADWASLQASGLALIEAARLGSRRLIADWVALGGDAPASARGFAEGFGYNAIRVPLYVFWGGGEAPELMRNFSTAWESGMFNPGATNGGHAPARFVEPGYAKILALARCAAASEAYPREFYDFTARQNYYPATLSALSTIAAAARGGPCLDAAAMSAQLGGATVEAASDVSRLNLAEVAIAAGAPRADLRLATRESRENAPAPRSGTVRPLEASEGALGMIGSLTLLSGLAGVGVALHRRRERQRKQRLETIFTPDASPSTGGKAVPRTLPVNPYSAAESADKLPLQMERAALASTEFGRTLGVIYFDLGAPRGGKRKRVDPNRETEIEELLARLRRELRATDHATIIDGHEIIACVGLLPGMTELTSISERLRNAGRSNARFADAFNAPAGLAIYPLDGYRGEDLINRARARHKTHASAGQTGIAVARPPRKVAAGAR